MLCEKVSSPQAPLVPRSSRSIYRSSSWQAMRAVVSGELWLVGSIPLDTPEDVFRTFGPPLGKYLFAMPDGEVMSALCPGGAGVWPFSSSVSEQQFTACCYECLVPNVLAS